MIFKANLVNFKIHPLSNTLPLFNRRKVQNEAKFI